MKMRFSTECDYNDLQRETVAECEHAACARFRVHIYSFWPTFSRIYVHYRRFMGSFWHFCCTAFVPLCCSCDAAHVPMCIVWSLNLLLLCSVKCIYMKRRLTFPFRLKPWRPDILLTVAADILPLFPQDYISPLLSPLISLSNILFLPPLICSTPLLRFNISPLFPAVVIALKRKRSMKTLRQEQKHTRITFVQHLLEKEEMSRAKPGLRDTKFHR